MGAPLPWPLLLFAVASTISTTTSAMNTAPRMAAARFPFEVVTPFRFTYNSESDWVAHPIFAASSGAMIWGISSGPCCPPTGPLANCRMASAIPASSSPVTSGCPSAPNTPSQRAERFRS